MTFVAKTLIPEYGKQTEITCRTLRIVMLAHNSKESGTVITAHLDEGYDSAQSLSWDFADDHPVFIFRREP